MRKATRIFLSHRPRAKLVDVTRVLLDGAEPNHCYQNACLFADANEKEQMVISGWLIGEFLGDKGTAIIPHYWVFNEVTRRHFDPTPRSVDDTQSYEYVNDIDIMTHASENNILPAPLRILANGKLQARLNSGQFIDLNKLDLAQLFNLTED